MGNESSTMVDDDVPPETLKSRTLEGVADYIKSGKVKRIVVMSGAGISTSAGIPDFRSPDTGLYANLARLNLPYAEAVFDISYFREHPEPFYTLANELYPGKFRPTITHSFIALLHRKRLLLKHFTQNIDCLDREAGVPGSHIVEAHGSFADQKCIDCGAAFPDAEMRAAVEAATPPHCTHCGGLVKPAIVFFGEALPADFFMNRSLPAVADLAIVLGTSLTVQPFAQLPAIVPAGTPRVLVNLAQVGGLGSRADDVLLLGDCDEQVRRLADACGWLDELELMWRETARTDAERKSDAAAAAKKKAVAAAEDAADEVEKLTREIDQTLAISDKHAKETRAELDLKRDVQRHLNGAISNNDVEEKKRQDVDVNDITAGTDGATTADPQGPAAIPTRPAHKDEDNTKDAGGGDGGGGTLAHVFGHIKSNLS